MTTVLWFVVAFLFLPLLFILVGSFALKVSNHRYKYHSDSHHTSSGFGWFDAGGGDGGGGCDGGGGGDGGGC